MPLTNGLFHMPVFHGIVVQIVHMPRIGLIGPDSVLPEAPLAYFQLAFCRAHCRPRSFGGMAFTNRILLALMIREVDIARRQRKDTMQVVRQHDPSIGVKGSWRACVSQRYAAL